LNSNTSAARRAHARGGFSIVELLVALMISSLLLSSTLAALDASFKTYKATTESASSHVVARMVMHRVTTMIRTGEDFGPYPLNPIQDPVLIPDPPEIEFVTSRDEASGEDTVVRLERRDAPVGSVAPYELWYIQTQVLDGNPVGEPAEFPLINNVQNVTFTLYYDVGPRLQHATVDLTIHPDDLEDAAIAAGLESASMRMVATISPRRVD
jgi:prepilin-type N-terminal cleavage/methylation domain-containing protein